MLCVDTKGKKQRGTGSHLLLKCARKHKPWDKGSWGNGVRPHTGRDVISPRTNADFAEDSSMMIQAAHRPYEHLRSKTPEEVFTGRFTTGTSTIPGGGGELQGPPAEAARSSTPREEHSPSMAATGASTDLHELPRRLHSHRRHLPGREGTVFPTEDAVRLHEDSAVEAA
jgi:hypothetical protein